ncbi:MAG: YkgJ family cysteine cluster protein, partial [Candidatus Omnitrophica bacterium]|nr:YkgJ family cysteine cluster protein [Candidatus Omnitrophota bacterium]
MTGIPAFVPSEYCLKCRGCCMFTEDGDWTPHVTAFEKDRLAALLHEPPAVFSSGSKLCLHIEEKKKRCTFLNSSDHHCRVYAARPFECALYPFVFSRERSGLRVYAHLACPFVTETQGTPAWDAAVAEIRAFFQGPQIPEALVDYSPHQMELLELFDVDPAGDILWKARPRIETFLKHSSRVISAKAFVNLFAWKDFFGHEVQEIDGNLCVFLTQKIGSFLYWPPLGEKISPAAVEACFKKMRAGQKGRGLARIENVSEAELAAFDRSRYVPFVRGHEYCY